MVLLDEHQFLQSAFEEQGFELFGFYDSHQVLDMKNLCDLPLIKRSDVLVVDTNTVLKHPELEEKFKVVLNTFLGVIFIQSTDNLQAIKWVESHSSFLSKIIGLCHLPMSSVQWAVLKNNLTFLWTLSEEQKALQNHLVKFSFELDEALQNAELEMLKAKKVHQVLVPRKSEEIKGVTFANKYAAGQGGGGEFYDLHQTSTKVYQILVSSQSYLISSSLIGLLNLFKQKDFNPGEFLDEAKKEIDTINSSKKKMSQVDIIIIELDSSSLSLRTYGRGKSKFISSLNKEIDFGLTQKFGADSSTQSYQMKKGEKIFVFSAGFLFNWEGDQRKMKLPQFLELNQHKSQAELMTELFVQLDQNKNSEFLNKDATVIMMEVNRHGIHQI
jgi:hypothetical protein